MKNSKREVELIRQVGEELLSLSKSELRKVVFDAPETDISRIMLESGFIVFEEFYKTELLDDVYSSQDPVPDISYALSGIVHSTVFSDLPRTWSHTHSVTSHSHSVTAHTHSVTSHSHSVTAGSVSHVFEIENQDISQFSMGIQLKSIIVAKKAKQDEAKFSESETEKWPSAA